MEIKEWKGFEDHFDIEKFQYCGIAELTRRYTQRLPEKPIQYVTNRSEAQVIAKGISAFLSIPQYGTPFPSLRIKLEKNEEKDLPNIFIIYFEHCLNFLKVEENRKLFEIEKRTHFELILQHFENEKKHYNDSILLFKETKECEILLIGQLKKAAKYYTDWIKESHPDLSSIPKTLIVTEFENEQLIVIKKRLVDKKIIESISDADFLYLFTGQPIKKTLKKLIWKGSRPFAHEFIKRVVFGDKKFNFITINQCISFPNSKELNSNDKSKAEYKNDTLNIILQF